MTNSDRPLSPHLQIYKPQLTSLVSVTHRATGVALAGGALVLTYWLNAASYGADAFERAQMIVGSWFGILLLIGWTWSLFFHLCNGIRHLFWDAGKGFEMTTVNASGWAVIVVAIVLTAITFAVGMNV